MIQPIHTDTFLILQITQKNSFWEKIIFGKRGVLRLLEKKDKWFDFKLQKIILLT